MLGDDMDGAGRIAVVFEGTLPNQKVQTLITADAAPGLIERATTSL